MANERIGVWCEDNPKTYVQGLYEQSADQRHPLGTLRTLSDGRVFAYAQAGGVALVKGAMTQGAAPLSGHTGALAVTAAAIGARVVNVTIATTAAAANYYREGYLWVNTTPGVGQYFKIMKHAAYVLVTGLAQDIYLYEPLTVALTTASKVGLMPHPQKALIATPSATNTGPIAGVPPIEVTASYYFWNQVKGPCAVLTTGVIDYVTAIILGSTAGSVAPQLETSLSQTVGVAIGNSGSGLTCLVNLHIPGY